MTKIPNSKQFEARMILYKTLVFAVSAFYAGIAGGLYAFVLRFIEPEIFTLIR